MTGDGVADAIADSWTYDPLYAVGEPASSQRLVNGAIERSQSFIYDPLARPTETDTHQQIATGSYKDYAQTVAYDSYDAHGRASAASAGCARAAYGRPKSIGYPNGEAVGTYYSKYGHAIASFNPADGTVYRQVTAVDARGNPTQAILGGTTLSDTTGLLQDARSYRATTGELLGIAYSRGASALRRLDYQTDVFGNLSQQKLNAGATVENYAYDTLQRMTQATRTGAVNASIAYAYDAVGNFTSKSDFSNTAPNAYTYTGGACGGGANAVKTVTLSAGGTRNYCYDLDGNLTSDNAGLAVKYDHDNLPYQTTRGSYTINLAYGPDNQRTREWGADGTKVYLDGGYEDWISQGSSKVYVGTEAEITLNGSTRTVNYLLTDRLGSVDSIADSTGTLVETRGSDAFGKPRTGTWADTSPAQLQSTAITARGFTEHEHLNSVQLIHMNGRVYDYQLGRFLSVDPIIQAPLNSQSLNPYSYIMNNPLAGTDPTGYTCETTSDSASDCSVGDHTITKDDGTTVTLRVRNNFPTPALGTRIASGGPTIEGNGPGMGGTAGAGYTIQVAESNGMAPNGVQAQGVTKKTEPSATSPSGQKDVVGTPEQDAHNLEIFPGGTAADSIESGSIRAKGKDYPFSECFNDYCTKPNAVGVGVTDATDAFHKHVISDKHDADGLRETFQRILPTTTGGIRRSGDFGLVEVLNVPSYVQGTDGVRRVIEVVSGKPRIRTVTPGAKDAYDQSNWRPGRPIQLSPNQEAIIKRFNEGIYTWDQALQKGGINVGH